MYCTRGERDEDPDQEKLFGYGFATLLKGTLEKIVGVGERWPDKSARKEIANYAGRKSNVSVRKFHKSAIKRRSKKKS